MRLAGRASQKERCRSTEQQQPSDAIHGQNGPGPVSVHVVKYLDDATYVRERLNFSGCQIANRAGREMCAADGTLLLQDSRHFVASISPDAVTASSLHRAARGHWQIENCLHFIKDRWWDEDRHYTKRPGLAELFAALTNAALSLLRLIHAPTKPLRATAELAQWRPRTLLNQLGFCGSR